jgi:hypothetical protein
MNFRIDTTLEKYRDADEIVKPPFKIQYHLWWQPTNQEYRYLSGPFETKEDAKTYAKECLAVYSNEVFIL